MKVLFINTVYGRGSTGSIVSDLGRMLEESGHEFKVAYGRGECKDPHCYRIGSRLDVYLHAGLSRITDSAGFHSKKATKRLVSWIREYDPDIIHLHNIHGYYVNVEILFEYLANEFRGRVIWTLHDCWAFTGHCVHFTSAGCDLWKSHCRRCMQKHEYPASLLLDRSEQNFEKKKRLFNSVGDLVITTPSKWLKRIVDQSFLGGKRVLAIYNGVDQDRFRPVPSNIKKELCGSDKKMILLVSDGWNRQKGLLKLRELAACAPSGWVFVVIGLNRLQAKRMPPNVIGIERIWDRDRLAEYYSSADVFLNLSVEETFGLVTAEAMSCGTPALVMNSSACPELIKTPGSGRIVDVSASNADVIEAIGELMEEKAPVKMPFTKRLFLENYKTVYEE